MMLVRRVQDDEVAQALVEPSARRVLMACVEVARSAKDVRAMTSLPLTTVYRQLHRLLDLGVLGIERSALTRDGRKYDLYRSRVRNAHLELDPSGERVRWEPNVGEVVA